MSLAPKVDEIVYTLVHGNIHLAFFSETWLKETVPDEYINIKGYQLFRRDRKEKAHGGVYLYVKDFIPCNILPDLQSDEHEVLWEDPRPNRLPRDFSNIILVVVYHPPPHSPPTPPPPPPPPMQTNDQARIFKVLLVLSSYIVQLVLAGDFNKLNQLWLNIRMLFN